MKKFTCPECGPGHVNPYLSAYMSAVPCKCIGKPRRDASGKLCTHEEA